MATTNNISPLLVPFTLTAHTHTHTHPDLVREGKWVTQLNFIGIISSGQCQVVE